MQPPWSLRRGDVRWVAAIAVAGVCQLLLHQMIGPLHEVCTAFTNSCGTDPAAEPGELARQVTGSLHAGSADVLGAICANAFDLLILLGHVTAALVGLMSIGLTNRVAPALGARLLRTPTLPRVPVLVRPASLRPAWAAPPVLRGQVVLRGIPRRGPPSVAAVF